MRKLKYFIPSFVIMCIIFYFSSQNGVDSSEMSSGILSWIKNILHIPMSEFVIRKVAHMCEYALLCLSLIYSFYKCDYSLKHIILYSIFITFIYACTDECHQLFIGGRAGQLRDVFIDTSGGFISCFLTYCYTRIKVYHSR